MSKQTRLQEAMTSADALAILKQEPVHVYRVAYAWCVRAESDGPPASDNYIVEKLYTAMPKPHTGRHPQKLSIAV